MHHDRESSSPVAPVASADGFWQVLFKQLDQFQELKPGWDGYSAPRPEPAAAMNVREFLGVLESDCLRPNRLKPSDVGGIGITFRRGAKKVYVEFYNDGRVHSLFSDGVSDPDTKSILPEHAGYVSLVQDIRGFLNA